MIGERHNKNKRKAAPVENDWPRSCPPVRDLTKALHFVGFKGEEFHAAVRVFGQPDFVHRYADNRMFTDVAPGDTVIFANDEEKKAAMRANHPSFNDSNHF